MGTIKSEGYIKKPIDYSIYKSAQELINSSSLEDLPLNTSSTSANDTVIISNTNTLGGNLLIYIVPAGFDLILYSAQISFCCGALGALFMSSANISCPRGTLLELWLPPATLTQDSISITYSEGLTIKEGEEIFLGNNAGMGGTFFSNACLTGLLVNSP